MITAHDLADVQQREWTRKLEYHLDLVPRLLGAMVELATPGVRAADLERPRVSGGGYPSNVPVSDDGAGTDATYLWDLLAEYAAAAAEWIGADAVVPERCPDTASAAFGSALVVVDTLMRHAHLIHVHRELEPFEREMFGEIRRMQRRYLPAHEGVPQHARACTVCGSERAVRVVWVDGDGEPRMVGVCRVCGMKYVSEQEVEQ